MTESEISREVAEKRFELVWTCNEEKRGARRRKSAGNGSAGDEEAGKAKTEMDAQDQRGHEGEGNNKRSADGGPSYVEASRPTSRQPPGVGVE